MKEAININKEIECSVILVTYQQTLSTKLIIESLLQQSFEGTYEIIVSDDGSSINLFKEVKALADKNDIAVKYVWQQDRGVRPTLARNNAIKLAKGKYLLFLDGDMIPEDDLIKRHIKAHTKPRMIVAGNRLWRGVLDNEKSKRLKNQPIAKVLSDFKNNWDIDEETKKRETLEIERRKQWLNSPNPWRSCFSCNLSIENVPEVSFDENYLGWGNEDWELAYRLTKMHSYTPFFLENAVAYHLETPQAITNAFRTNRHEDIVMTMKNICYFNDKCPGLDIEEAFFSFIRLNLDPKTQKWSVGARPETFKREDLIEKVRIVKDWLSENNIYKS